MSDTIEMRDRLLTQQLRAAIDESQKQLAAASHQEEKKA